MTVNVTLLRSVMDEILANPEKHDQHYWASMREDSCETAYCFAGLTCTLQGQQVSWKDGYLGGRGVLQTYILQNGEEIDRTAQDMLGLDDRSANILFHEDNTIEDLKHLVDVLADEGTLRHWHSPHWLDDDEYDEDGSRTETYF